MDNHIDKSKSINIPHIYVSPADSNGNKIKQVDNIGDTKEDEFENMINQVNLDNIEIPDNCLNLISNDEYNFINPTELQVDLSEPSQPNNNGITPMNSHSSYNEVPEDDIQSFYSVLEERFGFNDKSKNNVVEDFINNEIFGLNDQSANTMNNLQTSFLLPDMNKIKSNSSANKDNLLSISKVNSREGRRNSVSKSNRSRSATRSRSRSRSVTKSVSDLSHKDDTGLIDAFSKVKLLEKDKHNSLLNIDPSDNDYLSDVSDSDIRSILSEIEVDENPLDIEAFINDSDNKTSNADDKEKKHVCKYCNFAFLRHHDLERHTSSHINRKNYPCKGYVFGELPPLAMIYLKNEQNLKENPSLFDLNELLRIIDEVENRKSTTTWGCFRSFFRSDSLSRHLKSKTKETCLKQAYEDFTQGNVYFHHKFLSLKNFVYKDILKKSTDENEYLNSEKFIKADMLIKDMDKDCLDNETWPITDEQFERQYQKTYCKNLQKYIQREAKFKKMAEK